MKTKKKLKESKGSALILAILATALVLILIHTISVQVNNQIKSNQNSYENMKYKYMAEAGIERAIYDIEKDIKNKIPYKVTASNNRTLNQIEKKHESCPKVYFQNSMPIIGNWNKKDNTFAYLIYREMIIENADKEYNILFGPELVNILGSDYPLIGVDHNARTYYEQNLRRKVEWISSGHLTYNHNDLETTINEFIKMLDTISEDIGKSNNGTMEQRESLINYSKDIKDYMIEIKCRLGMKIEEINPQPQPDLTISIKLPEYVVSIKENRELSFEDKSKNIQITIKRNEQGELQNIDLSNLNNQKIISKSGNKKIEAEIEFIFTKMDNDYVISQKVNSYEQK